MKQFTHIIDPDSGLIMFSGFGLRTAEDDLVVMAPVHYRARTHKYSLAAKRFTKISKRSKEKKEAKAKKVQEAAGKKRKENLLALKDLLDNAADPVLKEVLYRLLLELRISLPD